MFHSIPIIPIIPIQKTDFLGNDARLGICEGLSQLSSFELCVSANDRRKLSVFSFSTETQCTATTLAELCVCACCGSIRKHHKINHNGTRKAPHPDSPKGQRENCGYLYGDGHGSFRKRSRCLFDDTGGNGRPIGFFPTSVAHINVR